MIVKFEYWQSEEDGQWYFHLRSPQGGILVQSAGYVTLDECLYAIDSVKRYADVAVVTPQNIFLRVYEEEQEVETDG